MKLKISIDAHSPVPIFQQIVDAVEFAVLTKSLDEDEILPSVRELAKAIQVNPNTIGRAYQYLQDQKLAESIRGIGLKVLPMTAERAAARKDEILSNGVTQLLQLSRSLGVSMDSLIRKLKQTEAGGSNENPHD